MTNLLLPLSLSLLMLIYCNFEQNRKDCIPIVVIELGIFIEVRLVHPQNVELPIVLSFELVSVSNVTLDNCWHSWNAESPMVVICVPDKSIEVRLVQ